MSKLKSAKELIKKIKDLELLNEAKHLIIENKVTLIWSANNQFTYAVWDNADDKDAEVTLKFDDEDTLEEDPALLTSPMHIAALRYFIEDKSPRINNIEGKLYTRDGMIKRVWEERREKARTLKYKIRLGKHLYGPHTLIDEANERHDITVWDFEKETGYIDNIDWKTNKLGTTKHILNLIEYIKSNPSKVKALIKSSQFVEIVPDPICNYHITYVYNGKITPKQKERLANLFGRKTHLSVDNLVKKMAVLKQFQSYNDFVIRTDVYDKLGAHFDTKAEAKLIQKSLKTPIDYSFLKVDLFPYQKIGIEFCVFKKGAILADEMGLGKTIQAMSIAILKKKYYDFKKVLIICPASVKYQ